GPRGGEPDRQKKAQAYVDPEQVAGQSMIDLLPLEDRLRKPVQPEVHQQQAEGGDHGHQPKICRSEKSSQGEGGDHLDGEPQALRKYRGAGTPNGEAPESAAVRGGAKGAIVVEGLHPSHPSSRLEGSGTTAMARRQTSHPRWNPLNAASIRL